MWKIFFVCACVFVLAGCTSDQNPPNDSPEPTDNPPSRSTSSTSYSLEEIGAHNTREDCWTVVNGTVADVTSFFGKHPGGDDNLAKACGKDATEMFMTVKKHDPKGYEMLEKLKIGTLKEIK